MIRIGHSSDSRCICCSTGHNFYIEIPLSIGKYHVFMYVHFLPLMDLSFWAKRKLASI